MLNLDRAIKLLSYSSWTMILNVTVLCHGWCHLYWRSERNEQKARIRIKDLVHSGIRTWNQYPKRLALRARSGLFWRIFFIHTYYIKTVVEHVECVLTTRKYIKQKDANGFLFHITNFPFLSSNIPSSPAYGVFISQLIRYSRACSSYECFILRARRLSSKLLKQGYLVERLKSSFRKFYGRYGDLIQQYEVSLSRMLNDILILDQQWLPNQSDFPPISWPWYRAWPSPNYEWFPWSICNGCG